MSERISYADMFGCGPEISSQNCVILRGDIVATGRCDWPRFNVVAVWDGKAWLRDVNTHDDCVVAADRCRLLTSGSTV